MRWRMGAGEAVKPAASQNDVNRNPLGPQGEERALARVSNHDEFAAILRDALLTERSSESVNVWIEVALGGGA